MALGCSPSTPQPAAVRLLRHESRKDVIGVQRAAALPVCYAVAGPSISSDLRTGCKGQAD